MGFIKRVISRVFKTRSKQSTTRHRKQKSANVPPILLLNIILRLQGVPTPTRNAILARLLRTFDTSAATTLDLSELMDVDDLPVAPETRPTSLNQASNDPSFPIISPWTGCDPCPHGSDCHAPHGGIDPDPVILPQTQDIPELSHSVNTLHSTVITTPLDILPPQIVPTQEEIMRADETIEASLICDPANDKANSSHIGSENPPFDISNHLADTISSDIDALECSLAAPLDNVVVSGSEAEIHATKPLVATQIIPSEEIPVCNSEHRPSREGGRSSPRILEFNGHQFTIMGTLGYGGFGFVWHAMMETGQEVAIKVIDKVLAFDHYMSSTNSTEDDNWRGSSLSAATTVWNEFKILEDLTSVGCAFLTPLLFSFSDDENFYLVMRLYPENLRQRMENRAAPLQLYQTRLLAAELVLAMETLHSMNIMHRDLKPENVFISPSGHLCVGDFGIAWQMPTPLSGGGFKSRKLMAVEGTFGYLSPEQSADQFAKSNYAGYDYKVDIYSVGLILLEMLVNDGRPWYRHTDPYFDPIYCGRKASPRPLWNLASVTDKNAADLVGKLLSDNPRRRPDWQEIREHPFFAGIDWNTLAERKYDPVYQACCSKRSRPPVEYVIRHHRQKLGSDFAEYKAYIDANKSHHASIGGLPIDFEILESMLLDRRHGSSCLAYDLCLCHSPSHWAMQGGRQCI